MGLSAMAVAAILIEPVWAVGFGVERHPAGGDDATVVGADVDVAAIGGSCGGAVEGGGGCIAAVDIDIDHAVDVDGSAAECAARRDRRVASVAWRSRCNHRGIAGDVDGCAAVSADQSLGEVSGNAVQ